MLWGCSRDDLETIKGSFKCHLRHMFDEIMEGGSGGRGPPRKQECFGGCMHLDGVS